jgi:redox-sensitive bicupin YhaK (pirin superfamily)
LSKKSIINMKPLGFPWETQNPFLFCAYHADNYPKGNGELGPGESLTGRNIGQDFVIKDGWRMYHGDKVPGFPSHPHRGFETITAVEKGLVDHADSQGAAGRYGNGDVQWMTAGSGLQHSEMFPLLKEDEENPFELFQIWLNLPKANKFVAPHFKMHWHEEIPVVNIKDENGKTTNIKIVAGNFNGKTALAPAPDSWASNPENEVAIFVIQMEAGAVCEIPATAETASRSLFFFNGSSIEIDSEEISVNHSVSLKGSAIIKIKNGSKISRFLFLQGKPINEPVVQYGPFVMNTNAEIQQAMNDYRKTQFGGWPWPRHDMVHGTTAGRFAKYADSKTDIP